jgi:antitoxin (DNA-binding transcriptional repressor) of toxin-antitoxin stability system
MSVLQTSIIMTMIMVNIFEVKAKLSEYLEAVGRGERVMICKRNRPIAELRAVDAPPSARTLGAAAGAVTIPTAFFQPLPDDLLDAFDGGVPQQRRVSKVAEARATYGAKGRRRK